MIIEVRIWGKENDYFLYKIGYFEGEKFFLHSFYDQPALIHKNGNKYWYKDDLLHRGFGPASLKFDEKDKYYCLITYYKNGVKHRENGPALIYNDDYGGGERYYKNGKLHREDGPAYIDCEYHTNHYYLENINLTEKYNITTNEELKILLKTN